MTERVITAEERNEDKEFEWSLRPRRLAEFIGQENVKANLEILITAARGRNEPIEHILIAGPPGLGRRRWPTSWPTRWGSTSAPPPVRRSSTRGRWRPS